MNLLVTTSQKPIIDTHTKRRKESKHSTNIFIKSQEKREKEDEKNYKKNQKTVNKIAINT